jgi:hypothetical protein
MHASFNVDYSTPVLGFTRLAASASTMNDVRNFSNIDGTTVLVLDYSGTCSAALPSPTAASASGMDTMRASFGANNSALNLASSTANSGRIKDTTHSTASSSLISKLLPPHRILFPFSTLAHMPMAATSSTQDFDVHLEGGDDPDQVSWRVGEGGTTYAAPFASPQTISIPPGELTRCT